MYMIIIGILLILIFLLPVRIHVLNIGNITGMICGLGFVLFDLYPSLVTPLVKRVLLVIGAIIIIESILIIRACFRRADKLATVVVLGCLVKGEGNRLRPSRMLKNRLDKSIEYLITHPTSSVIVTGGQGDNEADAEAHVMASYLKDKGIINPIYIEDQSTSTYENLNNAKSIIQTHHLEENILIVTNEFHYYRSGLLAGQLGLKHMPLVVASPPVLLPTYLVREFYAVIYTLIRSII